MKPALRRFRWAAIFLAGFIFVAGALAGEAGKFVSGLEDLPLMPGLNEVDQSGVVFDKPGGRIVESVATGRTRADQVYAFYANALPQLGWRILARGRFVREGEQLHIRTESGGGALIVRFSIAPN
jgi:hypothetical protein